MSLYSSFVNTPLVFFCEWPWLAQSGSLKRVQAVREKSDSAETTVYDGADIKSDGAAEDSSAMGSVPVPVATHVEQLDIESLYDQHFEFIWKSARILKVSPQSIADVVQDVFVELAKNVEAVRSARDVRAWLFGMVRNVSLKHLKDGKRLVHFQPTPIDSTEVALGPPEPRDSGPGPEEHAASQERSGILDQLLGTLTSEARQTVEMVELHGLSVGEVARLLDLPEDTIYSRLRRAREQMTRAYADMKRDLEFRGRSQ